ncbi:hypothetical protein KY361_05005 [Candidatus Woesearchaeota archaeon]|nr:hypothetical protein [Candidatus Woesearchaeota archaeon]
MAKDSEKSEAPLEDRLKGKDVEISLKKGLAGHIVEYCIVFDYGDGQEEEALLTEAPDPFLDSPHDIVGTNKAYHDLLSNVITDSDPESIANEKLEFMAQLLSRLNERVDSLAEAGVDIVKVGTYTYEEFKVAYAGLPKEG